MHGGSIVTAVLFVAIAVAVYVFIGRKLNDVDKPACVHQRVRVLDGETDECKFCGEWVR